ncbi:MULTISPECIES: hypothetical protein [unclassified Cryobacterium]|uniref:hypothetical protein n=1 Tax=unclassified Cryobacterium TaxID=2649013 RepID=UPI002AB59F60|nr:MULTISPECIES: hypothetical protein [unclassified Cryobacterium]MDY7542631.1 hypothetical protein [Cryobacterium sp. 5B3]MEB0264751.1 hypothetical protein [Cryobacterium sp. 10I5]MEB0273723.1 hypothetical protein [Cryobacterium sp. 5B3]
MSTIIKRVPSEEREIAMGITAATPDHWVVSIGEYADQGEADVDIRVLGAVDEGGNDISEHVAKLVAQSVENAISMGIL